MKTSTVTWMIRQEWGSFFGSPPREMVIPYEGLDYPEATLAEPITVALDLSREAAIELFDDVLIMGLES